MAYIVCHARKVKTVAGLKAVARHNCRENVYEFDWEIPGAWQPKNGTLPDYIVMPENRNLNFGDYGRDVQGKTPEETLKKREAEIAAANLKRKPQKNASAAVEFVFSASPDWFAGEDNDTAIAYLNECAAFVGKKYGHIIQTNAHFDEKTPHIHVLTVPIVGNKYTSSEFLGGPAGLRQLQQEIYQQVGKRYGLERGIEGSTARHNDQKGYKAQQKTELTAQQKQQEAEFAAYRKARAGLDIDDPKGLIENVDAWFHPKKYVKRYESYYAGKIENVNEWAANRAGELDKREKSLIERESRVKRTEIVSKENETLKATLKATEKWLAQSACIAPEQLPDWQKQVRNVLPNTVKAYEQELAEKKERETRLEAQKQAALQSQAKSHGISR